MVWLESQIVVERDNATLASSSVLTKMAFDAVPNMNVKGSATRRAAKDFSKYVKALFGE
jgi:hypothetical protein